MIRRRENFTLEKSSSWTGTNDYSEKAGTDLSLATLDMPELSFTWLYSQFHSFQRRPPMKQFIAVLVLACFAVAAGAAQDGKPVTAKMGVKSEEGKWHGYVVDAMCAKNMMKKDNAMEKAAKHTKECALNEDCAASGFGVFSGGKYYEFDDSGDKMAKEMIEKSSTEKGLMADVTGKMEGDKITVASIAEMKMEKMEMGKKKMDSKMMEKKEEHKH